MRRQEGFSILEVLIVMTIIGVLVAIAIPELHNAKIRAEIGAVTGESKNLYTAFKRYYLDYNAYPNASSAPAFDLVTFDPLTELELYRGGMVKYFEASRADAYDSPDDQGTNQEFWLEMTLRLDPSVRFLVADSNDAPLGGGAWMDGVFVYRNGVLKPI